MYVQCNVSGCQETCIYHVQVQEKDAHLPRMTHFCSVHHVPSYLYLFEHVLTRPRFHHLSYQIGDTTITVWKDQEPTKAG